jgi:thioredoxin reductase (NADPH)
MDNVVIIGSGPAGLSAALYNSRANLSPLVFGGSPPGGQLTLTSDVENFPGIDSIQGPELIQKMRAQAQKFNTRFIDQNIKGIERIEGGFKVIPAPDNSPAVETKAVIITTGAKALWLGLDSEKRLQGKGVSACATCDGFFFKNKVVAVVGGGDTAMEDAMTLTHFATKVYVIHRRNEFRASKIMQERVLKHEKIEVIWNASISEIVGEQKVSGVKYKITSGEEKELALDGVFVAIGHKPDTDIFKGMIMLDERGYIINGQTFALSLLKAESADKAKFDPAYPTMTSVPGIFAAGDCVDHLYRQASTSAGMGVAAALDVEHWLAR